MGDSSGKAPREEGSARKAAQAGSTRTTQWDLLPASDWLLLADVASRSSPLGDGLQSISSLEAPRRMGRSASHPAGVRQDRDGSRATSIGPHHRQPIGQDDRKRGPRGYDAGKKVKGRKRHILTDTQGLLVKVKVHPADIQDRDGARLLLNAAQGQCPRVSLLYADGGYQGALVSWIKETVGWRTEIVRKPSWKRGMWLPPGVEPPALPTGFHVLPRRWVVERTFAWIGRYRRFSKDYEQLCESVESLIYIAMTRLMLARLAA